MEIMIWRLTWIEKKKIEFIFDYHRYLEEKKMLN